MNEATLKSTLVKLARKELPKFEVTRYEDRLTSGIPDISVDGNKLTSWYEVKFANPKFASTGIQELTMRRKAKAAHYAAYIIFAFDGANKSTHVVEPAHLADWRDLSNYTSGFNHLWLVQYIRSVHDHGF